MKQLTPLRIVFLLTIVGGLVGFARFSRYLVDTLIAQMEEVAPPTPSTAWAAVAGKAAPPPRPSPGISPGPSPSPAPSPSPSLAPSSASSPRP